MYWALIIIATPIIMSYPLAIIIIFVIIFIVEIVIRFISLTLAYKFRKNIHIIHHIINLFLPGWILFYILNIKTS